MNTDKTWEIESTSSDDTLKIAEKIGQHLKGGEVIELDSDIGGGKTTFVRGLAGGIKSTDRVASPTFTISRKYRAPDSKLEIHHFDFYRIAGQPGLMRNELAESVNAPNVVTVVEWAESVAEVLPSDRLKIKFTPKSDSHRLLNFSAGPNHSHLRNDS